MKKNIFIIGLDQFNLDKLERLPRARECEFHPALNVSEIRGVDSYDVPGLIATATQRMEGAGVPVDAVASYWDFPGSTLVPILAKHFGVPGPSLQSVMNCEHKYWSRLEQQKVVPEHIPQFRVFDPFDDDAFEKIDLVPPYWIKPVKSFRSFLAYKINGEGQFADAMKQVREHIGFMNAPFNEIMKSPEIPPEIANMTETCIAESMLSGSMCTLEGYVYAGDVVGYGIIDSVRELDRSSFARYEYPSHLPLEIQHRMMDVARQTITQIGLDNSGFNIEFFYDQTHDQVYLLEINPRVSAAHTDIFEKVNGASHLRVMLDLALGNKPPPFEKRGRHSLAANFMLRVYEAGTVTRVPTPAEIQRVLDEELATTVAVHVESGSSLDELGGQDSYSFVLANLFIAGRDQLDILEKYDKCLEVLSFELQRGPERVSASKPGWVVDWNGVDVPQALAERPPGRYRIQSL